MKKIFGNISYFTPTLSQSCVIILLFVILGSVFSYLTIFIIGLLSYSSEISRAQMLISYLTAFIPVLAYIIYMSNKIAKTSLVPSECDSASSKNAKIPISASDYGKVNVFGFYIIIAIIMVALSVVMDPLNAVIKLPESLKAAFELVFATPYGILSVVIAAPLCEEFMMRGIIARGLIIHSTPKKAIIISAVMFGIIHLNPWQAVPAIIIGLFLGWVYYRTHSLWSVIFLHFINNGLSTLLYFTMPNVSLGDSLYEAMPRNLYISLYVFCVAITVLLLFYLNKKLSRSTFNCLQ